MIILAMTVIGLVQGLNIWAVWRYLPEWVWPQRAGRVCAAWCASQRLPLLYRYRAARTLPQRTLRGLFTWWMVWRISPAVTRLDRSTCRACGLRAKVVKFLTVTERESAPMRRGYRHSIQFHPPTRKLIVACGRCEATWPEEPIYAVDGWMPPAPPKVKGEQG